MLERQPEDSGTRVAGSKLAARSLAPCRAARDADLYHAVAELSFSDEAYGCSGGSVALLSGGSRGVAAREEAKRLHGMPRCCLDARRLLMQQRWRRVA